MRNFIILCLLFFAPAAHAAPTLPGPYQADIIKVIDGDTVKARIHIWLGQNIETLVRLDGIDTPELRGHCAREKDLAQQAKALLAQLIDGQSIELHNIRQDKYGGRIIAHISLPDGRDIATILQNSNLARTYTGGTRHSWC